MKNQTHAVFSKRRYDIRNTCPIPDGIIFQPKQDRSSLKVKVLCALLSLLYASFDLEQGCVLRLHHQEMIEYRIGFKFNYLIYRTVTQVHFARFETL